MSSCFNRFLSHDKQSGKVFPSAGFDQNTVRDSGNVNGIRDLIATRPGRGIRQNLSTDAGLGKKTILGMAMAD